MARPVEAELGQIIIDYDADQQQVWLVEKHGRRQIKLLIGTAEANALRRFIDRSHPPRPLTHELLDSAVRGLGGRVARVEITELRNAMFYARLVLEDVDGKEIALEARPSDSLVLALRSHAPLYVDEAVFAEAGTVVPPADA